MFILLSERTWTGRPPCRRGQWHRLRLSSGQTVHLQQETARHKLITLLQNIPSDKRTQKPKHLDMIVILQTHRNFSL